MLDRIEHDSILELRLNRPPVNALDPDLTRALRDAVRDAPSAGFRALIISGREGMFSGGLDAADLLARDSDFMREFWNDFIDMMRVIACSEIPVAAAITGHSPAGGAVIAVFADYRVMADGNFKIGFNEVRVGLPVPPPVRVAFKRIAPEHTVERMLVEGQIINAQQAAALGLVDELAPVGDVVERALVWAKGITSLPPAAMNATRRVARSGFADAFDNNPIPPAGMHAAWMSDEGQASMRAMLASLAKKKGG